TAFVVHFDHCRHQLFKSASVLARDYPSVAVQSSCADYTRPLVLPKGFAEQTKIGFFPGSSIGNCEPREAHQFLGQIASLLGADSGLLIGVDLKKDAALLNAAYNDSQGITAAFNLNVLQRINRELEGNFDLSNFEHRAFYNAVEGRVEMHLISRKKQTVRVSNQ